jgi:hypothetical protein
VNELVEVFADLYERSDVHFATPYDASTALYSMQGESSLYLSLSLSLLLPLSIFTSFSPPSVAVAVFALIVSSLFVRSEQQCGFQQTPYGADLSVHGLSEGSNYSAPLSPLTPVR